MIEVIRLGAEFHTGVNYSDVTEDRENQVREKETDPADTDEYCNAKPQ